MFKILVPFLLFGSFCEPKTVYNCPAPYFQNGRYRLSNRNRTVKYMCKVGFMLAGDRFSFCRHGKWETPPPRCVRPGCRKVEPPPNGLIYPTHLGATITFYCKSEYKLLGPEVAYCDGTTWSTNKPSCLPSNTRPSLSCDFESDDNCGWTHDLNHDFDWRRMNYNTPSGSIGTGPSFDHTKGSGGDGYYMYIETSSRNENDTSRLISPIYEATSSDFCFEFYYHMFGSTIGTLRVYLKTVNESWSLDPQNAFFTKFGNQGDVWLRDFHKFAPVEDDFQIIIEGVRGKGYVSDIAIDDVRLILNCTADPEPSTTTEDATTEETTTELKPDDYVSCENRCYRTGFVVGHHRYCSCDEACFDRNDCCPDYYDFCDYTTTTEVVTTPTETIATTRATVKIPTSTVGKKDPITTTMSNEIWQYPESSEEISEELVPPEVLEKRLRVGYNQKIVINEVREESDWSAILIGSSVVAIFAAIFVIIRKIRPVYFRSTRFRSGESQSDVRFLTSDEALDFNLQDDDL